MRAVLLTLFLAATLMSAGQQKPELSAADMQEDFAFLRRYLETTHPMLYVHHTYEAMQAELDSLAHTLDRPLPFLEFYKKVAFLIAQVGCEHTYCNYGEGYDMLLESAVFFPLQLLFTERKTVIAVNLTADKDLYPGDEILAINNRPIDSIRKVLHQYIPVDGQMIPAKDQQLSAMAFNIWYYLFIEQVPAFTVTVRNSQGKQFEKTLSAFKLSALNKQAVKNPVNKPVFDMVKRREPLRKLSVRHEFLLDNKAAILTVQSFSESQSIFRQAIDSFFTLARKNDVEKLLIDLRYNGGGDVELAADLLNYFITKPTSLVQYSYLITDRDEDLRLANIPDEIRSAKYNYIEPLKDGRSSVKLSKYSGELKLLQPYASPFKGKVYLFVNGGTSSAASTFAAVMKSLGLATVVGEETAGGFLGGGTVIGLDLLLPHSKITAHTGIVYQRFQTSGEQTHRGVIPDIPYVIEFEDIISMNKKWQEYILNLK